MLRRIWDQFIFWLDWHGRVATVLTIIVAVGGAVLVNKVSALISDVSGVYLYVITVMGFVIIVCSFTIAGRHLKGQHHRTTLPDIAAEFVIDFVEVGIKLKNLSPIIAKNVQIDVLLTKWRIKFPMTPYLIAEKDIEIIPTLFSYTADGAEGLNYTSGERTLGATLKSDKNNEIPMKISFNVNDTVRFEQPFRIVVGASFKNSVIFSDGPSRQL